MAESKKAASSSANQKEKSSLLDEEIGNEFLSSWKSMSVMEDDGMDFSFDAVPKGKKKAFDFGKLDMDFNLDGDLKKLSSFEVDMSELDFSSPPRKATKTKERSEEEPSTGKRQRKQDHFKFSFDFNEFDDFDFDSSLTKSTKISKNNQDTSKVVASEKADSERSEACLAQEIGSLDSDSEIVATSKVDSLLLVPGKVNSINDICASKSDTSENLELPHCLTYPEKELTKENLEERDQLCHSPEKTVPTEPHAKQAPKEVTKCVDESGQESHLPEKAMLKEPYAKQATKEMTKCVQESGQQGHLSEKALATELYSKQATHGLPQITQDLGGVDSTGNDTDEGKNEGCPQITQLNTISSGNEDANEKMSPGESPNHEDSLLNDSSSLNITSFGSKNGHSSKLGGDVLAINAEPAVEDLDPEDSSNAFVSRKTPPNIKTIKEDQHSTLQIPLAMLGSESTADKVTVTKESKTGEFHQKISKRLEEAGSHISQASLLIGGKCLSSGMQRIGTVHQCRAIEHGVGDNANDEQSGGKLLNTPGLEDRETNFKRVIPGREGFNSDGLPSRAKLVGTSQLFGKPVEISCSQPSPSNSTLKTTKPSTQTSVNSRRVLSSLESTRNTKIISVQGNRLCPDKRAQKKTDISTWNISKNTGGNKVPLKAAPQKEVKSLRSSEHSMEVQSSVELQTAQIGDPCEKQMPPIHSLKRKTFEGSNSDLASLKPLKRLSQSPKDIRNVKEPSIRVAEEQVSIHEDPSESMTQSTSYDRPTSGPGSPCQVNALELEIPLVMEDDGNVEKAEAYAKELEDICNMLKKKHEEAKEMLVRAVVNNNNLLMLNHPIYELKIQKVQKFAARLVSKEIQTCSSSPTIVM